MRGNEVRHVRNSDEMRFGFVSDDKIRGIYRGVLLCVSDIILVFSIRSRYCARASNVTNLGTNPV